VRILVTGHLGTLGRPLVDELREQGHSVWGCDLRHDGHPNSARADINVRHQLERVFEAVAPELVYHLAAEFGRHNGEAFTEQLWTTAMVGTRNVLELCAESGARLAFASSSEVYGEHPGEERGATVTQEGGLYLTEGITERDVILQPNDYALSKWAGERMILAFAKRNPDFEAMRLRFFNAYGPGEEPHSYRSVVALFCAKALRGEALPVFENYYRTFMYIDDFTPTLARVVERFRPGLALNIGGRDYRSVFELAEIVQTEVNAMGIAVGPKELISEDRHNTRSKRPDITTAEKLLDHDPTVTLEEGVPVTLEWMEGMKGRAYANR
jgi:dTDP-glucose 4,6-dehydratase